MLNGAHPGRNQAPWRDKQNRTSEAQGGLFQLGSAGTNPSDMGGFSFQLEGQDLIPEGLNVNNNTVLHEEYIWVENLILHIEYIKMS